MDSRRIGRATGILCIVGALCALSAIAIAEDYNFAGTWKGEYSAAAPAAPTGRTSGGGGPQKVTLRVKVNKEKDKATGNFTMGSSSPEDIREGKMTGNKLTFKTGLPPAAIYDYDAVLIGEDLNVTRTAEGGKGGKPQMFTLKVSK